MDTHRSPKYEYSQRLTRLRGGGSSLEASQVDTWEYRDGFDWLNWIYRNEIDVNP